MRRRLLLATMSLVATTVVALGQPAGGYVGPPGGRGPRTAAQGQASEPTGAVELVGQTPWVQGDQPFQLRLRLSAPGQADELEVAVTVYRRVAHRSEFDQTLQGRLRNAGFEQTRTPVTELTPDEEGTVTLVLTPSLAREGVYPVRVELREKRGGPVLDSFTTHLVYLPGGVPGEQLKLAWVVPVHAPPAVQPDGRLDLAADVADGLAVLAQVLETHAPLPLTLRPTPETLEALAASAREVDRNTLATLVRAQRGRQVLAGHFVPTNLPALLAAGLQGEAAAQLSEGVATVTRAFGSAPDGRTWVSDDRLDDVTLAHLAGQRYERLVVPEATLVPTDRTTTLTQPFELQAPSGRLLVAAGDTGLAAHTAESDDPVLSAYNLLADLAVVYFDHPGRPGGVVLAPPRTWRPTARFLDVVLNGLAASPIVEATTLDGLLDGVPAATAGTTRLVRQMAPAAGTTALTPGPVRSARRNLDSFASVLEPGNPLADQIGRRLLVSLSTDLRPQARAAYLDGAREEIRAQLALVEIPPNRSITLTARAGEIPVTITSRTGYPVRAVLRVQSGTLEFPSGVRWPLELSRPNTTERIRVRARGSGSFPLRVQLESPDGSLVLAESLFSVRSTAASGVGVAISVGAATFLLFWWASHLRGRRSRKLVPA